MSELYQDLEFGSLENEKKKLERTLDPGTYELMFSKWTYPKRCVMINRHDQRASTREPSAVGLP